MTRGTVYNRVAKNVACFCVRESVCETAPGVRLSVSVDKQRLNRVYVVSL